MKSCNVCGVELVIGTTWTEARKKHHMNSCNSCNHTKSKTWKQENKQAAQDSQRKSMRKLRYGLTEEAFSLRYTEQGGCCAICSTPLETTGKNTHIDHDHNTGKVRGLLCNNCNTGIGKFSEDTVTLQKAILYIERHKE